MSGIEQSISSGQRPLAGLAARVAVVLVAAVFAGTASAAGTYKWTDEQGVVHYSDQAPAAPPAKAAQGQGTDAVLHQRKRYRHRQEPGDIDSRGADKVGRNLQCRPYAPAEEHCQAEGELWEQTDP